MSADNSATDPAFQQLSPDNHGPWVVVTSCIFILLTALVVAVRLISGFRLARQVNLSDWLIVVATFMAIGQTICMILACNYGLGRHRTSLDESSFNSYTKSFYSSQMLLVISVAFAKASITLLIVAIKPSVIILQACYALLGVVALWALSGVFALAFQCDLPRPWDFSTARCINQHALEVVLGIFNILTDIAVIALAFFLMRTVQASAYKQWTVISLFACRVIVPVVTILSLTTSKPYFYTTPPDKPWYGVTPTIWSQIMLNLSLITACIPSLKRFLADLQSGAMAVNVTEAFEMGVSQMGSSGRAYAMGSRSGLGSKLASKLGVTSQSRSVGIAGDSGEQNDMEDLKYGYGHGSGQGRGHAQRRLSSNGNPFAPAGAANRSTVERGESIKGLTENMIQRTVDFKVEYEGRSSEGYENRPSPAQEA